MKIKVCGLTKFDQIEELISMKVDFFGFIFYEKSSRFVLNHLNFNQIKSIKSNAKVGVFVNEKIDKIVEFSKKAELNYIQLHGDENEDFISKLREKLNDKIEIIKVIRIGNQTKRELQKTINKQPTTINYFLFDTDSKVFGGTGKTFDWEILNQIIIPKPHFLSGGISAENFEQLQNFVKVSLHENKTLTKFISPFALDINSKFETEPGTKDLKKIIKFKNHIDNEFSKI